MNCCRRLHTRSLEETPMAIRGVSLLDMDFSKELVRRSVLWLHQVECDVRQRYGLGEALPRLSPMAAPGSGAFARFIGSADCTFATVERRKNATIRPSGATSLSTSRSNTRSSATGRRRTPWLTSLRPSSTPDTPT